MKKKIISIMLVLAMLVTVLAGCKKDNKENNEGSSGESNLEEYEYLVRDLPEPKYITPASDFAGGNGTEAEPYQISDAAQLALLHEKMKEDDESLKQDYTKAHYVLTADIVLNNVSDFENWEKNAPEYNWMPIGFGIIGGFDGVFDGGGHTVSGLYINTNAEDVKEDYGLFEEVQGTVKNLTINQSYIAVSGVSCNVGTLVGYLTGDGQIDNCSSSAQIYTYDNQCGGLAGTAGNGSMNRDEDGKPLEVTVVSNSRFDGTITQIKEGSLSYIGGIVGDSDGNIEKCVNNGTIDFTDENVDAVGGIVGFAHEGTISACENKGSLNCTSNKEGGQTRTGGIVGLAMLSATGTKNMSRGISVEKCINSGEVSGALYAGGIIGHLNQDHNKYSLKVSDCINEGKISSEDYAGGIIGYLACTGKNEKDVDVVIKGCENKAEFSSEITGGIIAGLKTNSGDVKVEDCKNNASLTAEGQHCAGIVAYWLMDSKAENINVEIAKCKNTGNLNSALSAGGIVSNMDLPVELKSAKNVSIKVSNCNNSGNITTSSLNGGIGGVIGVLGMKSVSTTVEDCTNSGMLTITAMLSEEEASGKADKVMTVARVIGGIVGRTGKGLRLSVDLDEGSEKNINSKNAYFVLKNCKNTGDFSLTDDRESVNVKNFIGGIIGYASGEKEYSILVEDCNYAGFERGLGNNDYSDVGTKQ